MTWASFLNISLQSSFPAHFALATMAFFAVVHKTTHITAAGLLQLLLPQPGNAPDPTAHRPRAPLLESFPTTLCKLPAPHPTPPLALV